MDHYGQLILVGSTYGAMCCSCRMVLGNGTSDRSEALEQLRRHGCYTFWDGEHKRTLDLLNELERIRNSSV